MNRMKRILLELMDNRDKALSDIKQYKRELSEALSADAREILEIDLETAYDYYQSTIRNLDLFLATMPDMKAVMNQWNDRKARLNMVESVVNKEIREPFMETYHAKRKRINKQAGEKLRQTTTSEEKRFIWDKQKKLLNELNMRKEEMEKKADAREKELMGDYHP